MSRRHPDSLIFDTIRLEGTLFVPALLEKAARGDHSEQAASDYQLPKGLSLADEQGRAFRIAGALWKNFDPVRARKDVDALKVTIGFAAELLRDALGYADLAAIQVPIEIQSRHFPITAMARGRVPVIVAPHDLDLDTPDERFAVIGSGTRRKSAYQLAQQFLNASEDCTWALVTNGRQLRLVRDSDTLTRPAYLEFDLELILANDRYADFAALWRLLHASRAGMPDTGGEACVWERWKREGEAQGERVRAGLRIGVQDALLALGTGFLEAKGNDELRRRIESGELTKDAYFQQLLRLVYRFLFLFTVEERGLLHAPDDSAEAREARDIYAKGYALRRLRDRSLRRAGFDRFTDLWAGIKIVFRGLSTGEPRLALPALGGLFAITQCPDLDAAALENRALLTAMRHLRWSAGTGTLAAVDYRNMGPEELGSVYECLLELIPTIERPAWQFGFLGITDEGSSDGNARKTSGSYYTPDALVQELLASALDPVIAARIAARPQDPAAALLELTVIDPACGSAHFLLGAARRIAEKLAELRAVEGAVRPEDYRHALREVIAHCVYGVDRNPMAIELARTALWLEGYDPGQPLSFLDHHLVCGDALLGLMDFKQLEAGIPNDAFKPLSGDHAETCRKLATENRAALKDLASRLRDKSARLFDTQEVEDVFAALSALEAMPDATAAEVDAKKAAYDAFRERVGETTLAQAADLTVAAFLTPKEGPSDAETCPTTLTLLQTLFPQKGETAPADTLARAHSLCREAPVLHWPLTFPQVFGRGGFDCVLGNPPWERIKLQEEEFFASREPLISSAKNKAERGQRIRWLSEGSLTYHIHHIDVPPEGNKVERQLYREFISARRLAEAMSVFAHVNGKDGGRYPLTGVGDVNTYALFAESFKQITHAAGRAGFIVPTGIATDDTTKAFFSSIVEAERLVCLISFENEAFIFPSVHHAFKFCLFVIGKLEGQQSAEFQFFVRHFPQLADKRRRFTLSAEDFRLINPNTRTCPVFRSQADAELTKKIYRRVPVLIEEARDGEPEKNPWGITFSTMFHMSNDSHLFLDAPESDALPLYEAKMMHQFDHCWASYSTNSDGELESLDVPLERKADPNFEVRPRYWVKEREVLGRIARVPRPVARAWLANDDEALLIAFALWIDAANTNDVLAELSAQSVRQRVIAAGGRRFEDLPPRESDWRTAKALVECQGWPALTEEDLDALQSSLSLTEAAQQILDARSPRWLMGWRDITNATNERTVISSVLPRAGVGNNLPLMLFGETNSPQVFAALLGNLCSMALDFVARHKVGGTHLNFFIYKQLPILSPKTFDDTDLAYIVPRVLELTYTSHSLWAWAAELGHDGPPFPFDPDRRAVIRAELDAYFAKLYGLTHDEVRYILDPADTHGDDYPTETFRGLKANELRLYKEYRTRRLVLEAWDQLFPEEKPVRPPRVPFQKKDARLYASFLVYACITRAQGRVPLRRMARAFSLLKSPKRLLSCLDATRAGEAETWMATFKEPIGEIRLEGILEELRGRDQIRILKDDLDVLRVVFQQGATIPTIPTEILEDAEISDRAAQIELSQEAPPPETEQEVEILEHFANAPMT